jgi:alcohol dehydrogenase
MAQHAARAAVYENGRIAIREFALPDLGADDMLVEVLLAGVDGSEIHMLRGELAAIEARAPLVFGDEMVGRVSAIGGVAAERRGLAVGDLVAVEAHWPCNACKYCQQGQYYTCVKGIPGNTYGWIETARAPALWGAYATHVYVPAPALAYRLPAGASLENALVSSSVLANALAWTEAAGVALGKAVAIIGPGPQGIMAAMVAKVRGADVVLAGLPRDRERLQFARDFSGAQVLELTGDAANGAHAALLRERLGRSPEVVIETAGVQAAKDLAVEAIAPCGTIANCSVCTPQRLSLDFMALLLKDVRLVNPLSHPHAVEGALRLGASLQGKHNDPARLLTHFFTLDEAERAVRTAGFEFEERPIKVAIRPS